MMKVALVSEDLPKKNEPCSADLVENFAKYR